MAFGKIIYHNFIKEKIGGIKITEQENKKELEEFRLKTFIVSSSKSEKTKGRPKAKQARNTVGKNNKLNDLDSIEWIKRTKSFWFSDTPPRDISKKE